MLQLQLRHVSSASVPTVAGALSWSLQDQSCLSLRVASASSRLSHLPAIGEPGLAPRVLGASSLKYAAPQVWGRVDVILPLLSLKRAAHLGRADVKICLCIK